MARRLKAEGITCQQSHHSRTKTLRLRWRTTLRRREDIVPDAEPTWLVITCREDVVRRCAVSSLEYELLAALQSGETIGAAIDQIASRPNVTVESLETSLHDWFRHWSAAKFFSGIEI